MALSVLKTTAVSDAATPRKKKKTETIPNAVSSFFSNNSSKPTSFITNAANSLFNKSTPTTPATTTQKTTSTPNKTTTTTKTTTPVTTTPAAATQAAVSAPTLSLPDLYELPDVGSYGERPTYQQSAAVQQAYNTYMQYLNSKPAAYQSSYQTQIDSLLGDIMGREAFSYDFNADPMYQMYRDNYIEQGRQAMNDAMAKAAALTGGYGSSYAATAGQQAYAAELQNLNNVIPELWQMAYDVYLNEGDEMRANMNLLQSLENTDYSRYRDTVSDWQTDRAFAWNAYNTEYDRDYGMYRDTVGDWESDRSFNYGADMDRYNASVAERDFVYNQYLDELDQQNRAEEFAYQQAQDALAQSNYEREWEYQVAQDALARASGGGSSRSSGGSIGDSFGYSDVSKGLKNLEGVEALDYLDLAVESGLISAEEADYLATVNNISLDDEDTLQFGQAANSDWGLPNRTARQTGASSETTAKQTAASVAASSALGLLSGTGLGTSAREAYLRKRVQAGKATSSELDEYDRIMNARRG